MKSEQSLKDSWDTVEWTNTHIKEIPEEREKGEDTLFEEIMR